MHPFWQYIQQYSPLGQQDWVLVEACLYQQTYGKGELILREGEICRNLYFLELGFLRFFTWQDGKDVSKFFTTPPYCFTSQRSFSAMEPALESDAASSSACGRMRLRACWEILFGNTIFNEIKDGTQATS